jgi:hypothetical protein
MDLDILQLRWNNEDKGYLCDILGRNDTSNTYDVVINHQKQEYSGDTQRTNIPREALSFVDVPYSTDMHLMKAFRHPLGIPDILIPKIWRNKEPEFGFATV